jgi:cell division protein FtsL
VTPPAAASLAGAPARSAPSRRPAQRPRRVSGPQRGPVRQAPARGQTAREHDGLVLGVLRGLEGLSSHRLLDRLIRGRLWIGIIAFALIGIVTLQLGLLKLNSGIGRALERAATLQRENAALSIENSELAAGNRVESQAASRLGMKLVPLGGLRFLTISPGDVAHAAAALRTPVQQDHTQTSSTPSASEAPAEGTTAPSSTAEQQAATEQQSGGEDEAGTAPPAGEASTTASAGTSAPSEQQTAQAPAGEAGGAATTTSAQAPAEGAGGGTAAPGG